MNIYRCDVTFSLHGKSVEARGGTDASTQQEAEERIRRDLLKEYSGATDIRFSNWEMQDLDEMDRIAQHLANEAPNQ